MRRFKILGLLFTVALVAAACSASAGGTSGGGTSPSSNGVGGAVTISNASGSLWTCSFNPFLGDDTGVSVGIVYESLEFVDSLENAKAEPWLATSYAWSNSNRTLTFTIRNGVKWSDGTPFSAKDVLFTFQLLKKYPSLDLNSVWSVLQSVSLKGTNQVVLNFKSAGATYFYYVADQVPIVPQHIWSKISKPTSYNDPTPVGTGPYEVHHCTGANIDYQRNPGYWQTGEPKIETVDYPAFTSNNTANEDLAQGVAQWGSQYIPNIESFYKSKSPNYHYWFPPVANVALFPNLKDPLLSQLAVREAISLAINRSNVSQRGESGYEPPSNQEGIVTPTYSAWSDSALASQYDYSYNPSKAESVLVAAGFKKVNGVFQSPSGQPLSFSVINISDYPDWVADLQLIQQQLAQVGIKINVDELSSTDFDADLYTGRFQLAYNAESGGPLPYYEIRQWLYSANSAPIGQTASSNWERFSSPAVDHLIDEYASTTSVATQHSIIDSLERVMLTDVPVIPVVEEVDWYQYDTASIGGWPTQQDPYAQPAAYDTPDLEVVLLHLYSK
jgi:peptide/nickel transport system substrate-binding protein